MAAVPAGSANAPDPVPTSDTTDEQEQPVMVWTETANVADEHFHPRTDDPWWNEASFITFRIPERKLMGLLYYYLRPNQNTANAGPMIWDPSGEDFYTMAHNGF